MEIFSLRQWFRNISLSKKIFFTVGVMTAFFILEMSAVIMAIDTLSSVRAYVSGENLWLKAE
ncbi:MAG: hypothetical protein ACXVC7_12940, partial [Bacteroidia bacterium]